MNANWNQVRKIEEGPALARASAGVILKSGEIAGTFKIAYPKDGAGRLTVILHEHGNEPQIGHASGYGYDKRSAAFSGMVFGGITLQDSGRDWQDQLRDAGYTVYTAL